MVVRPANRWFFQRAWFQILLVGLVLYYLLLQQLAGTGNPNLVPSVLMIGAFLVPVTFVAYLYEYFSDHDLPLASLSVCFLTGGIVGILAAGFLEYATLRGLSAVTLFGVGLIEESAKLIFPLFLFFRGLYRSEADGLLFGVASGMGFAALETMGYGFTALLASRFNIGALESTLFIRSLIAPAGHCAWTGLVCAVLWRERAKAGHGVINGQVIVAFVTAVVLHALWDIVNSFDAASIAGWVILQGLTFIIGAVSLGLLIRRVREAHRAVLLETPLSAT